jgi:signal recognition particle receptor subunit beta
MAKVIPEAGEVNARIVYWGIEGAGKRTSLEGVYRKLRPDHRGQMRELPTRFDPSVCYTVLPIELGEVSGTRTRIEMVAVPGAPEHAPTRKLLLDQVDGIVLVIDCEKHRVEENLASLEELQKALEDYARSIDEMPLVVQYNKRDLADAFSIEELHRRLGLADATVFEAVATEGTGLLPTLSTISKKVIRALREQSASAALTRRPLAEEIAEADPEAAPAPSFEPVSEPGPMPEPFADAAREPAAPAPSIAQTMEEAILAEAEHPERESMEAASRAASSLLDDQPWLHEPDELGHPLGARIGASLTIVSVGEATRVDDRSVRIPLVLGDDDGETSSLMLTVRLDPFVGGKDD